MSRKPTTEVKHVACLGLYSYFSSDKGFNSQSLQKVRDSLTNLGVFDVYVGIGRSDILGDLLKPGENSYSRLEKFLGTDFTLHKCVLADAWRKEPFGYTFNELKTVVEPLKVKDGSTRRTDLEKVDDAWNSPPVVPTLASKLDIFYMQMQDAYRRAGGQPVVFHIYDSHPATDELPGMFRRSGDTCKLHNFGGNLTLRCAPLIPKNMTLQVHQLPYSPNDERAIKLCGAENSDDNKWQDSFSSERQHQFIFSEAQIAACTRAGLNQVVCDAHVFAWKEKQKMISAYNRGHHYSPSSDFNKYRDFCHAGVTGPIKGFGFARSIDSFQKGALKQEEKITRRFKWLLDSKNKVFVPLLAVSASLIAIASIFTALAAKNMVLASDPLMITAALVASLALVSLIVFASFLGKANHVSKYSVVKQLSATEEAKQGSEPFQPNADD